MKQKHCGFLTSFWILTVRCGVHIQGYHLVWVKEDATVFKLSMCALGESELLKSGWVIQLRCWEVCRVIITADTSHANESINQRNLTNYCTKLHHNACRKWKLVELRISILISELICAPKHTHGRFIMTKTPPASLTILSALSALWKKDEGGHLLTSLQCVCILHHLSIFQLLLNYQTKMKKFSSPSVFIQIESPGCSLGFTFNSQKELPVLFRIQPLPLKVSLILMLHLMWKWNASFCLSICYCTVQRCKFGTAVASSPILCP